MGVLSRPETPCRGVCSHCVGDEICRGCGRTIEEVREWGAYAPEKRKSIMMHCDEWLKLNAADRAQGERK